MSSQKQAVTVRDLVEEAKKRIVILVICVVGLSYLLSLTSSSVWVNLPAAACLIILLRYFSFDVEMKRKAAAYNNKPSSLSGPSLSKPPELPKAAPRSDWRSKVNSQVVEDALDRFTRHLVSEWVLDLWYSRITPDKQGPEELVFIINHVLGELSRRFRNVNLIDLFTRDIIDIICRHVELFRECQAKIERKRRRSLSFEERDSELRRVMATNDKLHPALFSPESEHKVLQHIMDRLISLTFRPEDMHCAFFHYTVRELLACCVMRPVLNLANPRFINERIEAAVMSRTKTNGGSSAAKETSQSEDLSEVSHDHFSRYMDPSVTGVELVQLKHEQKKRKNATDKQHVADLAKDPLLSMDTRSSRSWESLPLTSKIVDDSKYLQGHRGGEGWGDVLEKMSQRKTETLSPEHLESVWAKGRNYKKKEGERVPPRLSIKESCNDGDNARPKNFNENTVNARGSSQPKVVESHLSSYSSAEEDEETNSSHSSTSEDEETVTGLNSPGTRVWDGRTNKNPSVSRIHHPLENSGRRFKQTSKGHERYEKASRHRSSRKRSKRSGLIQGDDDSDDSEHDSLARSYSGISATSSASYNSVAESDLPSAPRSSLLVDSFAKLRCEVTGANIVKSSSKMFAVYSISVTDDSNHSWSIKRRFRHFEELHQRLKVFPEYNLYLPPKHFLSTGVDIPVIHERCVLLDTYLKKLLQLPRISGSIEVWDFLSVDSQTYAFSSSFSIIETLTVKPARKTSTVPTSIANMTEATPAPLPSRENLSSENGKSGQHVRNNVMVDDLKSKVKAPGNDHTKTSDADVRNSKENGGLKVGNQAVAMALPGLPTEWVPPKLTLPLLDLVDVVLQLQEGGWIRRKAFWVAKQILQLGMGDALDDWVLEKIRLLRRGTVVASGIQRRLGSRGFVIPAATYVVFLMTGMTVFIIFYDRVLVPTLRRITGIDTGITLLQRIGTGIFFAFVSLIVSGFVEERRRTFALTKPTLGMAPRKGEISSMSAMWLIPQLALAGIAEAFGAIGQMEFYYKQFPENMRSFAGSIFYVGAGVSSYLGSFLIAMVHRTTQNSAGGNWLAEDLNKGRLDYFYFMIAGILAVNFAYFLVMSRWYRYKGSDDEVTTYETNGDAIKQQDKNTV